MTARHSSGRQIGVEEEFMLVTPGTWALAAVSGKALRSHRQGRDQVAVGLRDPRAPTVGEEIFLQQIESQTEPCATLAELDEQLREGRRAVCEAAQAAGALAAAMATPVLVDPHERLTPKPRYHRIYDEFGELSSQSLVCGMHVHVEVGDVDEGVAAIDRLRPWMPVLLAVSANSPYWRGRDTRYASWRAQIWNRWPSAAPSDPFGDAATYAATSRKLIEWGAALDEAMLYYDARLARLYPTVEVRVTDVCAEVDEAVLVAALVRALVSTPGEPLPEWRTDLLKAASWRGSRYGITGRLVHPLTQELAHVRTVLAALIDQVHVPLQKYGDLELVESLVDRLLARGNGAVRQRSAYETHHDLGRVVRDVTERTAASWR